MVFSLYIKYNGNWCCTSPTWAEVQKNVGLHCQKCTTKEKCIQNQKKSILRMDPCHAMWRGMSSPLKCQNLPDACKGRGNSCSFYTECFFSTGSLSNSCKFTKISLGKVRGGVKKNLFFTPPLIGES